MMMPKWSYFALWKLIYRFSERREIRGIPVAFTRLEFKERRAAGFIKIQRALDLTAQKAPVEFAAMQRDVAWVLVLGNGTNAGTYNHALRKVELCMSYTLDSGTTPEVLACLLIHEAQHARLHRLGFGYGEEIRGRIERLCYRAERNLGRLLPGCEELVENAESWMEADPLLNCSNEAMIEKRLEFLRKNRFPEWFISFAGRQYRRKYEMAER
jgi:hypothetical protein